MVRRRLKKNTTAAAAPAAAARAAGRTRIGPPPGWKTSAAPAKAKGKDNKAKVTSAPGDMAAVAGKAGKAPKAPKTPKATQKAATDAANVVSSQAATVSPAVAEQLAPAAAAVPAVVTSAAAPPATKAKAASARAARRTALNEMEVADLRTILKGHGVESPSKMVKSELVRAILNKEHKIVRASRGGRKSIPLKLDAATLSMYGEDRLRKIAVQRSKGKPVPATLKKDQLIAVILATRSPKGGTVEVHKMVAQMLGPTATKTKKGKSLVRHGLGPFRIVFSKDSKVVGDLGPYASARAASTDAKTLLRTAAPIDKYAISQRGGQQAIEAGQTGDIQGEVVDGYIVTPKGNAVEMDLDAFVYQPKARNVAYAHDKLTKFMPGGSEVAPMKLRANPKFRANRAAIKAKLASMNPKKRKSKAAKRNGKVAFRTRDGRTISFNAR